MKIHEFQAKELLGRFGVPTPRHMVADTPELAQAHAEALGTPVVVVKAQVHAGGRGKGRFEGSDVRGVMVVKDPARVGEIAAAMLGHKLVTVQTGPAGVICHRVLVEEGLAIARELYVAVTLDRARSRPCVIASSEGGMDIEEVAASRPEAIHKEWIDPALGLMPFQARRLAFQLGLGKEERRGFVRLVSGLARAFTETDASLVEINPLVVTEDRQVLALDAKMSFDDNALFRHPDIAGYRDDTGTDPAEIEARERGLSYIKLEGNIGCLVNGAGLAMATMDIIKLHGGEPANFLDVGGGANAEKVAAAFRIILSDANVRAILVNIFGGIMRCDVIAEGVIEAAREVGLSVPLVVRLEGTNVERGRTMLRESGLPITEATDLADAADKVVAAAGVAN
ncbi:MAG: ADP-forming succinate--CoA ligase subunit beta [Planctomycetota bacterium]|nr:MAG: ADP-forming succinate--CoA ligase subunit beta [Planctomycetota bacterium]